MVKICPDGSSVGRDPHNNCEFRPCPDIEPILSFNWKYGSERVYNMLDEFWVDKWDYLKEDIERAAKEVYDQYFSDINLVDIHHMNSNYLWDYVGTIVQYLKQDWINHIQPVDPINLSTDIKVLDCPI